MLTAISRMAPWRRYLIIGLIASAVCIALPRGVVRDVAYCLIGLSGAIAILAGVRRNRPAHPSAWYLIAAGTVAWALGDALYGWFEHVALVAPFPSLADAFYLPAYLLFAGGLLVLVRSRVPARGSDALLDTAILTVGLGLPVWIFLIQPTWSQTGDPYLSRLVGSAYPFCDVLLFGMLMRLSTASGTRNTASRLVAASVGALLFSDVLFASAEFLPAFANRTYLLDFGWLASYVLWGTAALHPSMTALSSPAPERLETTSAARMVILAAAVAVGPFILAAELVAGVPLHNVAVTISSVLLVPLILVRMIRLVHQLERQSTRLVQLADTDYVTGLVNHRYFVERLGALLAVARPEVNGLLLVHLERLSEINDTLGEPTGDAILHAVGVRLSQLTGKNGLVARMGNDRFGVLDPAITSNEEADCASLAIREAVERPLELPDLSVSVEVSIGALVLPDDGAEPELALLRANAALSVARARSGRTARYGVEMESADAVSPRLIGELGEAIAQGEIVVHYQPQVEVRTGRVLGVEALVRWQHPRHGLLGPDSFVPAAEQTGLMAPLTQYVLNEALRQCALWHREGLDLTVAVNLSVRNLLDPGLVNDVRAGLRHHGLQSSSLELEITETSAMVNPRHSIEVLGTLAALGVSLSIDDYGTGHSSLAYLQKLPVDRLKLDSSFVTRMTTDPASAAIVGSTIELARLLRFDVVAEGVEDDATLIRLRDLGCGTAQGFNLGPPVTGSLLPDLIARVEKRLSGVLPLSGMSQALPRE